jgi:hypothetical protein
VCCLALDLFHAPQAQNSPALFEGPQPVTLPTREGEAQVIAISATGPRITMFAGNREIARVNDASFRSGGMGFGVTAARGEVPSTLRLIAFDLYEPAETSRPPAPSTAGPPARGTLLFDMADHLTALTQVAQRGPQNTISANGTSLDLTAGSEELLTMPLGIGGIASFVATVKFAAVRLWPMMRLHFGNRAVQIPVYKRLGPADGAPASGSHVCCQEFDIFQMPAAGRPTLFTGPPPRAVAAAPNQEQTVTISVQGPQIVVYADGREIARASSDTLRAGAMSVQVQAARRQLPAVVRLNALQIYEPSQ